MIDLIVQVPSKQAINTTYMVIMKPIELWQQRYLQTSKPTLRDACSSSNPLCNTLIHCLPSDIMELGDSVN